MKLFTKGFGKGLLPIIVLVTVAFGVLIYFATRTHTELKKEAVSYGYKKIEDPNLPVGKVNIIQTGKAGEKTTVLHVNNWFNSIQAVKSSDLTIQPVDQIAIVGVKKEPTASDKALEKWSKVVESALQCSKDPKLCSKGSNTSSSGYDAGYQWASDNNVCDTNYDNGNSEDFNQGVQDWASDSCTN